ncbi:MAG: hypothetical protein ABI867_39510 [Kofleriaceae bacterium]
MRSLLLLGLVACTNEPIPPPVKPEPVQPAIAPPANPDVDARFVAKIREAAAPYRSWKRVDEQPRVAPTDCAMPSMPSLGYIHMSEAADAPHGKKLYYLWASNGAAYRYPDKPMANGFTIVKESYEATPMPAAPERGDSGTGAPPLHDKLKVGDGWLTTGAAKGLYVMTKVGEGDGTDAGWIYGTITTAGEITSAGRVASCMGCHDSAPHDRLFGLKRAGETHGH